MSPTRDDRFRQDIFNPILTRRRLLGTAAALGLTVSAGGFLAACGGDDESATLGPTGDPVRGGRLRVGHVGGGTGESVDPKTAMPETGIGPVDARNVAAYLYSID